MVFNNVSDTVLDVIVNSLAQNKKLVNGIWQVEKYDKDIDNSLLF